jgi:multimeric flavodoxin WrbA
MEKTPDNPNGLILGIAGSIRSNHRHIDKLGDCVERSETAEELKGRIWESPFRFSNSDLSLAFALLGVKHRKMDYKIVSIVDIFKGPDKAQKASADVSLEQIYGEDIDFLEIRDKELDSLFAEVEKARGIILSSPVYFGDRSSTANKFMQLSNKRKALKDKVFGMIAAGAKRNGGQETTCIYGLYDALMQDAVVVGNGPATAQYGGTVVAGEFHTAMDDPWGLERCYELGCRVSDVAKIMANGKNQITGVRPRVRVIMTMDTIGKKYRSMAEEYLSGWEKHCDIAFLDLIDREILRCAGCKICPAFGTSEGRTQDLYTCLIRSKRDSMRDVLNFLKDSDCLVFVGVNTKEDIIYRYQAFTERTRFIRHDNFLLTNAVVLGMHINECGAINNPIHNLKVVTSYIRHNTIVLKPVEIICRGSEVIHQTPFDQNFRVILQICEGRRRTDPVLVSYGGVGYATESFVEKTSLRA